MTTTLNNSFSVSVVIVAFHGEKFIGELLKSLFTQTYPPSEILIGDDSHDNQTLALLTLYLFIGLQG